jgi:signal transduction histidine kinase
LVLPLLHENRALGVVVLLHSRLEHFQESQAELLEAACAQLAAQLVAARRHRAVLEQTEKVGKVARERDAEATRMRAILLSIADGVVVGDRMGRVLLANAAAELLLGIRADRFIGRSLAELPGVGASTPTEGAAVQQICVGDHTLRAHFAPVLTNNGEWLGSIVIYHDMTHEALAERHRNEFVAMASHELRTPLTAMRGYIDLLLLGTAGPLNESQQAFLTIIKTNATRQIDLIEDLLDMSKIEAGEAKLRPEELHVVEVVEEVTQALYGEFAAHNITLDLELPPELPPVMADRQRVAQIVMNLVGNACKYTPPGGCVRVALRNGGGAIEVLVRDSGVGISEQAKPRIFSRFFRADNPLRDKVKGTGLGLAITKMLVELHGGKIWFESEEGQGSTFVFTLPVDHDRLEL